jgi:DNA-binding IclR family transcriptional regulator
MAGNTSTPGATVVSRALALLFAFDQDHRQLRLTELADRAGLSLPTTHRLAAELVAGGALVRRPTGAYVVGRRLWDLGLLAPTESTLREVAVPFLSDIHATTRATVHLAVRDDTQALYLERLTGPTSVPIVSTVGSRLPLHSTGVGKVLLAHAPPAVIDEVLGSLRRLTPYTVVQPVRMREQLAQVRRTGYATTNEEMTLGACSLAVPVSVLLPGGEPAVVAAVGVVVQSLRRGREALVAALQVAARGIIRDLQR